MKKKIILLILFILAVCAAAWGPVMSHVEQAKYALVEKSGAIEIRDYDAMIVAEAEAAGEREAAINQGFGIIADYIFGNNIASQKVAMTAPVTQQASEKIAMTAPVTQQSGDSGGWKVRFVMPSSHTMETLPKPKNEAVTLHEIPAKRYAVIRFSGTANPKRLEQEKSALDAFIKQKDLTPKAQPVFAFFNPPWTLPFLRRNEVMMEIEK